MGCSQWGHEESDTTERLHFHFSLSCIGEGNGNPLQCSCLENPRDRGAWRAAMYGVAQSWTQLKQLSSRFISPSDLSQSSFTSSTAFTSLCLCLVTQLCPIFCNPMNCRPPGSSVHGAFSSKNPGEGCHALLLLHLYLKIIMIVLMNSYYVLGTE